VSEKPLNRELKSRYLLELLRKVRPGQALAIKRVMEILGDEGASDQNVLKASALMTATYTSLVKELYGRDEETEEEETDLPFKVEPVKTPINSTVKKTSKSKKFDELFEDEN